MIPFKRERVLASDELGAKWVDGFRLLKGQVDNIDITDIKGQ